MQYTQLKKPNSTLSRICFGIWRGEWGSFEKAENKAAVIKAPELGLGINFFDTPQTFSFRASKMLMRAVR